MNALLVDDDRYFVAALREKIDWPSLGIEEVYSAYNIRGAREIIERHAIRVMLCDRQNNLCRLFAAPHWTGNNYLLL